MPDCRVKDKIKNLNIDKEMKQSLCKILLNSSPKNLSLDQSDNEDSSTNEDLRVLQNEDYRTSKDEYLPCQTGQTCENKGEDDVFYNIYSQFQDLEVNVLEKDKLIEFLQMIKDPRLRSQIIE